VDSYPADTADLRKARGAFFTPDRLAAHVAEWAVRTTQDRILEPSCGEAAFLLAAGNRLRALANGGTLTLACLDGVELHRSSAVTAQSRLRGAGVDASVRIGDFFALDPSGSYDAVVGNPPYVRYQEFAGESRLRAREAALRAGVSLTNLASSWAAFTVHAALFLRCGGRLGLVLPAELLTVNYAAEVRGFLMDRFARVDLVLFEERVFPGVLEEVVLLLADGYGQGPTEHCRVFQARNAEELSATAVPRLWKPQPPGAKWTPSLLSPEALDAYVELARRQEFTTLQTWGETTLGMVTGNNRYFALPGQRVAELGLQEADIIPLSPPGSRHLRGLTFTESAWEELRRRGAPTWLFRPDKDPSKAARDYIAAGQATGVDQAYKCRIRNPWWRVPLVPSADLFLTYMNADTPRFCVNRVGVHHLNSVHGVYLRRGHRRLGRDLLPLATLNSMTLLGAETVGRAYGGGMLKIEPREADRLPVPSPALVNSAKKALSDLRPQMASHLRSGRLAEAARLIDSVLLVGELGMSRGEVRALRAGHADLTARRIARGATPRGAN
jgi:adenine-specific DNA methylase